jgi:hypothetical protein
MMVMGRFRTLQETCVKKKCRLVMGPVTSVDEVTSRNSTGRPKSK